MKIGVIKVEDLKLPPGFAFDEIRQLAPNACCNVPVGKSRNSTCRRCSD